MCWLSRYIFSIWLVCACVFGNSCACFRCTLYIVLYMRHNRKTQRILANKNIQLNSICNVKSGMVKIAKRRAIVVAAKCFHLLLRRTARMVRIWKFVPAFAHERRHVAYTERLPGLRFMNDRIFWLSVHSSCGREVNFVNVSRVLPKGFFFFYMAHEV